MSDLYRKPTQTDESPRCWRCGKLLAIRVSRPWSIRCGRCKALSQDGGKGTEVPTGG